MVIDQIWGFYLLKGRGSGNISLKEGSSLKESSGGWGWPSGSGG